MPSLTAMGFTTHVGDDRPSLPPQVYAQPFGRTANWRLKYTVTLQTPPAHPYKHVSSIIVSAVLNVHPFLGTWLACLLSITSWARVAVLSGYLRPTVLHALHSPVPRTIARTPQDVDQTLAWYRHVMYILPPTRDTIFFQLHHWVRT